MVTPAFSNEKVNNSTFIGSKCHNTKIENIVSDASENALYITLARPSNPSATKVGHYCTVGTNFYSGG